MLWTKFTVYKVFSIVDAAIHIYHLLVWVIKSVFLMRCRIWAPYHNLIRCSWVILRLILILVIDHLLLCLWVERIFRRASWWIPHLAPYIIRMNINQSFNIIILA